MIVVLLFILFIQYTFLSEIQWFSLFLDFWHSLIQQNTASFVGAAHLETAVTLNYSDK